MMVVSFELQWWEFDVSVVLQVDCPLGMCLC